ncbi:MAG: hypothetical protein ACRDUA_25275 [Micromonosporaceae bacterium]
MPDADLSAQVIAMAREQERTQRRLAEIESMIREFGARFEARVTADEATDDRNDGRSWLEPDDPEQAHAVLADLLEWLARIYLCYPSAALPSCWLWHPAVVEELWWLRQSHREAYSPRDGSPGKVADWHDRHRPGVVKRISAALRDCDLSRHGQPGPAPTVPLVGSAARVADAWSTAQTTPQPTPDELAEADQHEHQQHRRTHHR